MPLFYLKYVHTGVAYVDAADEREAREKFRKAVADRTYEVSEDGFTRIEHCSPEDEPIAPSIK